MKQVRITDWRRWIAMLCVALIAFVVVEQAGCNDPCKTQPLGSAFAIAQMLATDTANDRQGAPEAPAQSDAHHCFGVHAPAMPASVQTAALDRVMLEAATPFSDPRATMNEQSGPDRPPRASAIV